MDSTARNTAVPAPGAAASKTKRCCAAAAVLPPMFPIRIRLWLLRALAACLRAAFAAIDIDAAQAAPGVLAVLTAADMAGRRQCLAPVRRQGADGARLRVPHRPALAGECVRHVGDPVALVVAETEAAARDAAELVEVDYDERRRRPICRAAAPGAPQIWPEAPGNIAVDWRWAANPRTPRGTRRIFAGATHVARVPLVNQRIVVAPMEPRGAHRRYEPATDRYVLRCASQSVACCGPARRAASASRATAARRDRRCRRRVRHARSAYPEYPALLIAARRSSAAQCAGCRPARRGSSPTTRRATPSSRPPRARCRAASSSRSTSTCSPLSAPTRPRTALLSRPRISRAACRACTTSRRSVCASRCLFTNTVPTGPYRGAGRPEANYCLERLVDEAARVTGIDRIELPPPQPHRARPHALQDAGRHHL